MWVNIPTPKPNQKKTKKNPQTNKQTKKQADGIVTERRSSFQSFSQLRLGTQKPKTHKKKIPNQKKNCLQKLILFLSHKFPITFFTFAYRNLTFCTITSLEHDKMGNRPVWEGMRVTQTLFKKGVKWFPVERGERYFLNC